MHPLDNEFITIGNLLTEYRRRFGKEIDLLNLLFSDFNIDLFIFISYENRKVYFTKKKDKYIPRVNFSFDFFYLSENRDVYIEYYSEVDDFSYDEIDITIKNKLYFYENLNLSANKLYRVNRDEKDYFCEDNNFKDVLENINSFSGYFLVDKNHKSISQADPETLHIYEKSRIENIKSKKIIINTFLNRFYFCFDEIRKKQVNSDQTETFTTLCIDSSLNYEFTLNILDDVYILKRDLEDIIENYHFMIENNKLFTIEKKTKENKEAPITKAQNDAKDRIIETQKTALLGVILAMDKAHNGNKGRYWKAHGLNMAYITKEMQKALELEGIEPRSQKTYQQKIREAIALLNDKTNPIYKN